MKVSAVWKGNKSNGQWKNVQWDWGTYESMVRWKQGQCEWGNNSNGQLEAISVQGNREQVNLPGVEASAVWRGNKSFSQWKKLQCKQRPEVNGEGKQFQCMNGGQQIDGQMEAMARWKQLQCERGTSQWPMVTSAVWTGQQQEEKP